MSIISTTRPAGADEIVAEMDRRGDVIVTLEAHIAELEHELDASQQRCRWAEREWEILRDADKPASELRLLYSIREAMGWTKMHGLSLMPSGVKDLLADSKRYHFLKEHCASHYPMTHEQPAEWSIGWEFQQSTPTEAYGSFDKWIDRDIEGWATRQAEIDAEESATPLDATHDGKVR